MKYRTFDGQKAQLDIEKYGGGVTLITVCVKSVNFGNNRKRKTLIR